MKGTTTVNTITINVHITGNTERRHYTVAQLIAELQTKSPEATVIIKDLNTGTVGSIDFQGLSNEVQA